MKFDHQNIFFSADLHFFHGKVIQYANRPFKDVQEMNRKLIENINSTVGIKDHLFLAGDVFMARDNKEAEKDILNVINQITCKNLYLILGNHDHIFFQNQELRKVFKRVDNYLEIKVKDEDLSKKEQKIILFHFPILEWNTGHHGSWMLHGHTHGNLKYPKELANKKILDIGVDCHNYKPISYNQIKQYMRNKENITHHNE